MANDEHENISQELVPADDQQPDNLIDFAEIVGDALKEMSRQHMETQRYIAQSQRDRAVEETRRTEIMGRVGIRVMLIFGALTALIIGLGGAALWTGQPQLAEKIVIAAVVLVSVAFGRSSKR